MDSQVISHMSVRPVQTLSSPNFWYVGQCFYHCHHLDSFFLFHTLLTLDLNVSYERCYSELICLADLHVIIAYFKYIISRNIRHVRILYYVGVPSVTVDIWAVEGCKDKTLVTSTSPKLDILWKNSWNWKQASDFQRFMRQSLNYRSSI